MSAGPAAAAAAAHVEVEGVPSEHVHDDSLCPYCKANREPTTRVDTHPVFVYMASISEEGVKFGTDRLISSRIGISKNPFKRLQEENRAPGFPIGSKLSQKGAPYWQPELVIGPFEASSRTASRFKDEWRRSSRKLHRRIVYGVRRALEMNLTVYARDPEMVQRIESQLPSVGDPE